MKYLKKKTWYFGILVPVVLLGTFLVRAQNSDFLKYSLEAKPGDTTVDRMPSTTPKSYTEEFTYTVTNPTRTDFKGSTPTSQRFDVEVYFLGIDRPMLVWKWSGGQFFSQIVTPVQIPAGKNWKPEQKVVWTFTASQVKDGKYRAVATYIPTENKKAISNFTISSVQ
jgi:hypothetical protein